MQSYSRMSAAPCTTGTQFSVVMVACHDLVLCGVVAEGLRDNDGHENFSTSTIAKKCA